LRGCNVGITDGGFMNFSFEMGSGGMINIPSFIKIGSGIPKLLSGGTYRDADTHRHTQTAR
jgi:hypothetical protein